MAGSESVKRTPLEWARLFLRGLAMGIAEIVPGVSGGTIAFITGIYAELVGTLGRLPERFVTNLRAGIPTLWRELNVNFLLCLGAGWSLRCCRWPIWWVI